ncbi:stage V sporulation protein AE [Caldisalinibacter kiritimatiensis]|uniref:Stage V sporulation protein AE (SpoVAE) n=1 Tax=Caldisalinibacter kiritimatiensis TaxID=1304284 RepID=R1CGV0_9FIRM|nr:stage V sporulation protein AE [Caldisalinibacter kiritimatiensis]EOD01515.1 Stage V sporulation protein AE (SpoVAE) [Caldisalinibacter kiritimatiensis]
MDYLRAFLVGGAICVIGQILMDTTKLTPAHVLVSFVTSGVVLTAIGIYEPIVELGKAGATVPLPGFGYALAKGVIEAVDKDGIIGVFTGGITATAGGVAAAVFFGYIMALLSNPKSKS